MGLTGVAPSPGAVAVPGPLGVTGDAGLDGPVVVGVAPWGDAGAVAAPAPVVGSRGRRRRRRARRRAGLEVVARLSRCACSARGRRGVDDGPGRGAATEVRPGHLGAGGELQAGEEGRRDGEDRRGRREDPSCRRAVGTAPPALAHDLHLDAVGTPARAHEHDGLLGAGHGVRVEVGGDGRDDAQHGGAGDGADDAEARAEGCRGRCSHRAAEQLGQGEVEQLPAEPGWGWVCGGVGWRRWLRWLWWRRVGCRAGRRSAVASCS